VLMIDGDEINAPAGATDNNGISTFSSEAQRCLSVEGRPNCRHTFSFLWPWRLPDDLDI